MNKNYLVIMLAAGAILASILACSFGEMSLTNARMAYDEDGANPTTVFSPLDVKYIVADMSNGNMGSVVTSTWFAVNVEGLEPNYQFQDISYTIDEENFTGTIFFELSNDGPWPVGDYRVDLYLDGALIQSVSYSVR